ncbi:MAG: ATP-binding cassette domain-containing protein [Erysipelotrichaceae bacterium]|nr:ATP-binding cassette domain-containing protein [Erysipelotrichaceae bacterium]
MEFQIENLHKSFGSKKVLQGVDLHVVSGEALGLLGRNGAGKTTIIRIILDLFGSDQGRIMIDGKDIGRDKIKIGYLPEERGLYPKKKIDEQLVYFGMLKGMSKKAALKSIDYYLDRLDMNCYKSAKLETLSKGNQQKIQLIVALLNDPDIVILDEPFSGLDPVTAQLLKEIVIELIDDNKIVIFSSHQMNYIEEFCNNIAILNNGRIVLDGKIDEIKRSYPRNRIKIKTANNEEVIGKLGFPAAISGQNIIVELENEIQTTDLLKELASLDIVLESFNVIEPTLNDVFVEYTKEGI